MVEAADLVTSSLDPSFADLERIPIEEVFEQLKCNKEGLTSNDGEKRLQIFGPNKLEANKRNMESKYPPTPYSAIVIVAAFMALLMAYYCGDGKKPRDWHDLWGMITLLVLYPRDWQDLWGMITLLVLYFTLHLIEHLVEENSASKAAAAVMAGLTPKTMVLRDGRWSEQDAAILVPGDIISIKPGDIVPADVLLLEEGGGDELKMVHSSLTGKWLVVTKKPGDKVFSGWTCKQGELYAVVIATGVGKMAVDFSTDLNLHAMMNIGDFCLISTLFGMIGMGWTQYQHIIIAIENILVLMIGGIPTAMPIVVSVTMAIGSHRLSKQGAITKRMTAIEKMAGMDVLCSDMTGTLTLNKMSVDKNLIKVFAQGVDKEHVLLSAVRASRTENVDDVDAAIVNMLADPKEASAGIREVQYFPFNPFGKRSALTYIDANGCWHRVSKGAAEQILDLCNATIDLRTKVHSVIDKFAEQGLRSLAVARQEVPERTKESPGEPWQFVGLLPLFDPLRHDSAETISRALVLGVNVKMITGGQLAIAKETGRRLGMGTNMYSSNSLFCQDNDELIEKADVFAEVFPVQNYKIVKRLQERKHVCGMTGDGVYDVPALMKADIGIAVAGATDAARCVSDIVLTEPGLSVIISALLTSRAIFQRMKSYTIYAVSITFRIVLGFTIISLIWKFDFSPFMVLILVILNDSTVMITFKDPIKPSSMRDSWNLKEICATGIVLGSYLALTTVTFFWAMKDTDFFSDKFGVRSLRHSEEEMISALFLHGSIMSGALIFVTQSRSWSFLERPGLFLVRAFIVAQLIASLIAVYVHWSLARMKGIGWGWAGVIWLYSILSFFPLDCLKFAIRFAVKEAQRLRRSGLHLQCRHGQKRRQRIGLETRNLKDEMYPLCWQNI